MTKALWFLPASLLLAAGCASPGVDDRGAAALLPEKPDIILVSLCSLSYSHTGLGGYGRPTTPFLDSLGKDGVFFRNAISASSWTQPAMVSLLTGLTPGAHRMSHGYSLPVMLQPGFEPRRTLHNGILTLPEALASAGYATMARNNSIQLARFFNILRGVPEEDQRIVGGAATMLADLDHWLGTLRPDQPFFFFMMNRDAHRPYLARYDQYRRFVRASAPLKESEYAEYPAGLQRRIEDLVQDGWPVPRQMREEEIDFYDGALAGLDADLSELPRILERHGRRSRAVIVVTADHGDRFCDGHGKPGHGNPGHGGTFLDDPVVHVPLLFSGGGMPKGRVIDEVVSGIDLFPTLAGLAGAEVPATVQGRSLLPLVLGQGGWSSRSAFARERRCSLVRDGRYAFHVSPDQELLYDLASDPGEQRDLSISRPEVAARLKREDDAWRRQEKLLRDVLPAGMEKELPSSVREQLRASGYLR